MCVGVQFPLGGSLAAAPDFIGFAAAVFLCPGHKAAAAFRTFQLAGERIAVAVAAFLAVSNVAAGHFPLDSFPHFPVDDGFVVVAEHYKIQLTFIVLLLVA